MQREPKQSYEFGPFRLDPVKRVLLKDGAPVPLTSKAFDVLLLLVENQGQSLAKSKIIDHVWPETFIEEGNLPVHISALRKVLGEHRSYIKTIPGRGYRFVAAVREVLAVSDEVLVEERLHAHVVIESSGVEGSRGLADEAVETVSIAPKPIQDNFWTRWRRPLLAMMVIAPSCLLIGVVFWWFMSGTSASRQPDWRASLQIVRVAGLKSDRKESMNSGRLSPDGNLIVFSAAGEGLNLWVRQINGGQPYQLTRGPWHDHSPVWSPNQQRIAFISDRDNQLGIWSVPFLGGEAPTLLKVLEPKVGELKGGTGIQQWLKDETIDFSWNGNIHALNVASKEIAQITQLDPAPSYSRQFRVSSKGDWIVYLDKQGEQFDLWRIPAQGGAPEQVTHDAAIEQSPVWHPDGKRLIYTARLNGRSRIYQAYFDGRPPEMVALTEDEGYIWDISGDGSRLLYYGLRDESDLWEVATKSAEIRQMTSDIGLEFWPQSSPDGQALVFHALQGERIIWEPQKSSLLIAALPFNGQLMPLTADAYAAQWSPDSRKIAFLREASGRSNLFVINSGGGEARQLTNDSVCFGGFTIGPPFNAFCTKDFSWSPDGSRIVYCSKPDRATNQPANLWTVAADGSSTTKLSDNPDITARFSCPIWSPAGKQIAYIISTPQQDQISWKLRLTDAQTDETLLQTQEALRLLGWTAAGDALIVATVEDRSMNLAFPADITLLRVTVTGAQSEPLARISNAYLANFHLSPDARNITYVSTSNGRDEIYILPVDGGEARKITHNPDPKSYFSGLAWSPDGQHIYYGKQECWNLISLIENFK